MNKHFLAKLGEFFRINKEAVEAAELTPEEVADIFRKSRAHAGGKQKAENRMTMAELFSKDTDRRLFFEKEFAEPPVTIQVLPRPGTYRHAKYGDFTLTSKNIQEFVDNHNNRIYQQEVPIDAEHQTKLSGAVGYYREMRVIDGGKGGAEADVEWTDRGKELIATDAFKYFSPEYFDVWIDPANGKKHNNVIAGGAITTRPFFKDKVLRPLVSSGVSYMAGEWDEAGEDEPRTLTLSAMQFTEEEPEQEIKQAMDPVEVHVDKPIGEPEPSKDKKKKEQESGGNAMTEEINEATKAFVEQETKALKEQLEAEQGRRQAAEERLVKMETDAQSRRFADVIRGVDGAGDGSPTFLGAHEHHQKMMSLIAKEYGEGSEEFTKYISWQRDIAGQAREAGLFKEVGSGASGAPVGAQTATKRFEEAVSQWLTENPGKNRGEATIAISNTQSKLYVDYVKEQDAKAARAGTSYGYEEESED